MKLHINIIMACLSGGILTRLISLYFQLINALINEYLLTASNDKLHNGTIICQS